MAITKLEQIWEDGRRAKFGDRLEWELVQSNRETTPATLDNPNRTTDHAHWRRLMADYKHKFGIDALEMDGSLGYRLEQARTLEEVSNEAEKARLNLNGASLRTATATVNGRKTRFWFELSV